MREFDFNSYFTKYSCSGNFELKDNNNTACFAQVVEILKKKKRKFTETYHIRCYDASNKNVLGSWKSNKCFLNQRELLNHVKQLRSIMDIKGISVKKIDNYFLVSATISAYETSHHYFLNWVRKTYEFPFNMYLLHARRLRRKLFRESIFNLYNIVAYAYRGNNYSHDTGCGGTLYTVEELKKRLLTHKVGLVNSVFPNIGKKYLNRYLHESRDLEIWQDEKDYEIKQEKYLEIYDKFKKANGK